MWIGLLGAVRDPFRPGGPAAELAPLLTPGLSLRACPSRVPAFPHTPVERLLQQVGHLDAALVAVEDGCTAMVIDSVGDYGLEAIQAATPVPVFGAGFQGMAAAGAGGRRFGIVTVWPASMNFIPQDLLHRYGFAGQCLGIDNVGQEEALDQLQGPDGYLAQVRDGAAPILATINAAVARMAASGAEAVLLGCTCMSPLAGRIAQAASLPVINPLQEAVRAAVGVAATAASGSGRLTLRPGRRDLVSRMVEGVAADAPEDCPVCIVASLEEGA
ncbi:aspartate/glutamate racemase family protein [Niveispirillum fermenti]|uniref:aspartate/glutamate racemase family protein n=1 Tax=Niveispirillum fermenti TaxID=1233113 RepID=UPI003A83F275